MTRSFVTRQLEEDVHVKRGRGPARNMRPGPSVILPRFSAAASGPGWSEPNKEILVPSAKIGIAIRGWGTREQPCLAMSRPIRLTYDLENLEGAPPDFPPLITLPIRGPLDRDLALSAPPRRGWLPGSGLVRPSDTRRRGPRSAGQSGGGYVRDLVPARRARVDRSGAGGSACTRVAPSG